MSNMNDEIDAEVQAEAPRVVGFFFRPVPLWVCGVTFLVGALLGKFS